jgi:superfamily II DNA/RNA helicase
MPPPIKKLADKFLSNPKQIEVERTGSTSALIEQGLIATSARGKKATLRTLLKADDLRTAIVFANRKTTVRELAQTLQRDGFKASEIHGDMDQASRIRELERFKAGEINILVASDVAARGLDIKGVSHVFNYDIPWHPDDYVHRIGRTGRAGATGKAYSLFTPEDAENVANIEKLTKQTIPRLGGAAEPEVAAPDEPAPRERAERKPRSAPARKEAAPARAAPRPVAAETASRRPAQPDAEPPLAGDADAKWNGPVPSFLLARIED